ncbi:MAG: helix-turn-helix domain-containing protein [Sulfuricaulis sp.]|nr:helix-turn-helix domain-containing protein [Sulfuricaulis sp.]
MKGDETKNMIKVAARRLFATRGINGVSVREIATAANQRNSGSVHYYFRTKEALVRELVADGAKLIDERRNAMLDEAERDGRIKNVRTVIELLVQSSSALDAEAGEEDTYIRFISLLQGSDRQLFLDALEHKWNSGYQRCLAHIRRLLPNLPQSILSQRLVFMGLYLNAALSAREAALDGQKSVHRFWSAPHTMDNFVDTAQALLEGKSSVHTTRKMLIR